jgi:hypothetical protein
MIGDDRDGLPAAAHRRFYAGEPTSHHWSDTHDVRAPGAHQRATDWQQATIDSSRERPVPAIRAPRVHGNVGARDTLRRSMWKASRRAIGQCCGYGNELVRLRHRHRPPQQRVEHTDHRRRHADAGAENPDQRQRKHRGANGPAQ